VLKHKIELDGYKPCVTRPYKLPQSVLNKVQKEINRLLEAGAIRESLSDFCSPMVPVKKENSDEIRITVNFSRLNAKTKDIAFSMTNPTTLIGKVTEKKWVSSVDMRQSFFQIELEESCKKFTAFWAGNSSYEFNRSSMGLKTSPAILQKLMTKVLRGTDGFTASLLDDVMIFLDTWEDHLKHIDIVLQRFREACLTLNNEKCQFCFETMKIVGYTLKHGKLLPSDDKIEAISKLGPAKTKKGVEAILGLAGYYRNLIPNFAETTYCLTELLKKNQPDKVRWEQKHAGALETLKQNLISKPVLTGPKFDREFFVFTDATQKTVAAILAQR